MTNHVLPLLTCNVWLLTTDSDLQLANFSCWSSLYSLRVDHTENTDSSRSSIVACLFVAVEFYLPHHCLAMAISCSTIPAFIHHVAIWRKRLIIQQGKIWTLPRLTYVLRVWGSFLIVLFEAFCMLSVIFVTCCCRNLNEIEVFLIYLTIWDILVSILVVWDWLYCSLLLCT